MPQSVKNVASTSVLFVKNRPYVVPATVAALTVLFGGALWPAKAAMALGAKALPIIVGSTSILAGAASAARMSAAAKISDFNQARIDLEREALEIFKGTEIEGLIKDFLALMPKLSPAQQLALQQRIL
jgi:hypothetical protein